MDNNQLQYTQIQSQYTSQVEQFGKCVVKVAEIKHTIDDTAEKKCEQARIAIKSGDIDVMWNTIQQYIHQYGQDWSRFQGVQFHFVDSDTHAQLSAADLIQQLHCIITWMYKDTALKTASKETSQECAKSLLKQLGLFTDNELDAIFAFA